jgi:exodeoxyribonuclease V alpha subunit
MGSQPAADSKAQQEDAGQPFTVRAELVREVFASPDGQRPFAVWTAVDVERGSTFTARGDFLDWGEPGDVVRLYGRWTEDPRYGRQFQAESLLPDIPQEAGVQGLGRWLERQPGLGEATAAAAARAVGDGGLEALAGEPEALARALGAVPPRYREALRAAAARAKEDLGRSRVLAWCLGHGLGQAQAEAVWNAFGPEAVDLVREDPWRLAALEGFGFATSDGVAAALGVAPLAGSRLRAAVVYAVERAAEEEGHVYLPGAEVVRRAEAILRGIAAKTGYGRGVEAALGTELARAVEEAVRTGVLRAEDGGRRVYLPRLWAAEAAVRAWIAAAAADGSGLCPPEEALALASRPEVRGELDPVQAAAVAQALGRRASVLTGGPGTGKTTTVKAVLAAARRLGIPAKECLLAAPTGRAARRLSEVTGLPARTIHRLLEYSPGEGFRRDASHPLEGRLLVVDEASMIDLPLLAALLQALPPRMAVLLVGDADQLPPVGPGAPFHFLCRGGPLPVARLERVYRTDAGGAIARAAAEVHAGRTPVPRDGDPAFREAVFPRVPRGLPEAQREAAGRQTREAMAARVVEEVRRLLAAGARPGDVQVLVPMRRGPLGTGALNDALRPVLNPSGARGGVFRTHGGGRELWVGDRVVQGRNDYDKGVFNGEQGTVVAAGVPVRVRVRGEEVQRQGFVVEYPEGDGVRRVEYWAGDARDVSLAFACTVHKAQGSEYPHVVFALGWDAYRLLSRSLVYTAVSRARETLAVVREEGALEFAVARGEEARRYQALGG